MKTKLLFIDAYFFINKHKSSVISIAVWQIFRNFALNYIIQLCMFLCNKALQDQ